MGVFYSKLKRAILVTGLGMAFLLVPSSARASSSEPVAANETLVRYFMELALSSQSFVADGWGNRMMIGDESSIEKVAKGLMAEFLASVSSQLVEIRKSLVQVHEVRASWGSGAASDGQSTRELEKAWREALERLAKQSSKLRKDLSFPLVAFKSKVEDEVIVPEQASTGAYEEEVAEMRATFNELVQRINVAFFTGEQTVNVQQLTDDNELQLLHRLEILAKELSKNELPPVGVGTGVAAVSAMR